MIDFDAMRRHGVAIGFTPGANRRQVAELTLCLRLGRGLCDVVVGLHGCGHIGKDVVGPLKPFGCEILACDLADFTDFYREHGVTAVSFGELLARSDALSLHLPKTAVTT